ncbi:MAG: asparagine synthase-related protein [Myxococcota bacterium]
MNGLAGFVRTEGLADPDALARMTAAVGPRHAGEPRVSGPLALGVHATRGRYAIAADVRLDDRDALRGFGEGTDAELLLRAYEAWGEELPARLVGDFAFAIWDGRALFCARDGFGARPLVWGRTDRVFAFASDTRALHALGELPRRRDPGRIADFLVDEGLETIDATSTFWRDLHKLAPGHALTLRDGDVALRRFWAPAPRDLGIASYGDAVDAFRATFTEAVRCRTRGEGVASMLSGGIDSASIVGVARRVAGEPFPTFSAIGDDPAVCPDRRFVEAAVAQGGLAPTFVRPSEAGAYADEVRRLLEETDDPFDVHAISIPMLPYVAARRAGVRVLLDGVDGDLVTSQGGHGVLYALRERRIGEAWARAGAGARYWGERSRVPMFADALRAWLRPPLPPLRRPRRPARPLLAPGVVDVDARLRTMRENARRLAGEGPGWDHARKLDWAAIPVALDRYGRAAASQGVEASHPYLDRRVVELCVSLPWAFKTHGGVQKSLLRDAMRGIVAEPIRARVPGASPHFQFTDALARALEPWLAAQLDRVADADAFVDVPAARGAWEAWRRCEGDTWPVLQVATLVAWLGRASR